jgi:hypothetical protein
MNNHSFELDRAQLLTQKLLKCYVAPGLKLSLQTFYSRHHEQVNRYEIFISQMAMEIRFRICYLSSMNSRAIM